jgi:tripartite-type tricarboxylate transporter receptor subunit TctC
MRVGAAALAAAAMAMAAIAPSRAAESEFFAGKTVQVLIGFSSGGGYDLYARTVAHHLGRHLPGNPQLLPQNMPGAGSLKVVNYLYNVAPKDGTAIALFAPGVMSEPLLGRGAGAQFDATKFSWLGSASTEVSVCAFMASSGINSWHDMQTKSYVIGASGGGAESDVFATVLRNMFHLPLKIVTGYPGGTEINLAMERHEVDGRCGWSWTSLQSRSKALLTSKQIDVALQIGLEKDDSPYLKNVPLIMELTHDPAQLAALKVIVARQSIARPFAAPPGVPAERLQLLREAFDATMKDPDFLAEARKVDLDIRPVAGKAVEALIKDIYASPPAAVKLATEVMKSEP